MEAVFNSLPEHIQVHLRELIHSSGLPDNQVSLEDVSRNWLDKKNLFQAQIRSLDMIEVEAFAADEPRGALALTYSGSLISLGPLHDGVRRIEYHSIKLRPDVPEIVKTPAGRIRADTGKDAILEFEDAPIRSTSALFAMAVCHEGISPDEQEARMREAVIFLTHGFVKINRSLTINRDLENLQFTMKSIMKQVAARNDISQADARKIIDDYLIIIESGMLLGERVPLGRMGRLWLKMQPARQARIGKNPKTGEELMIKARPETPVPKMAFSSRMKERAATAELALDESSDRSGNGPEDDS